LLACPGLLANLFPIGMLAEKAISKRQGILTFKRVLYQTVCKVSNANVPHSTYLDIGQSSGLPPCWWLCSHIGFCCHFCTPAQILIR
jgi:hypothetical protein